MGTRRLWPHECPSRIPTLYGTLCLRLSGLVNCTIIDDLLVYLKDFKSHIKINPTTNVTVCCQDQSKEMPTFFVEKCDTYELYNQIVTS